MQTPHISIILLALLCKFSDPINKHTGSEVRCIIIKRNYYTYYWFYLAMTDIVKLLLMLSFLVKRYSININKIFSHSQISPIFQCPIPAKTIQNMARSEQSSHTPAVAIRGCNTFREKTKIAKDFKILTQVVAEKSLTEKMLKCII